MNHLRHISLHVEEPEPGDFFWVLLESEAITANWAEHSTALHAESTWGEAWSRGVVELKRLVSDNRIGPRTHCGAPGVRSTLI